MASALAGRDDILLFHRRATLFGRGGVYRNVSKAGSLQWAVAPAVAAPLCQLVVNILTKENLESARNMVDIRNTVTKYIGSFAIKLSSSSWNCCIPSTSSLLNFILDVAIFHVASFWEAIYNLIVLQTFHAFNFQMKHEILNSIIQITRGLITCKCERNSLESTLQENKRRLFRSISIIFFLKLAENFSYILIKKLFRTEMWLNRLIKVRKNCWRWMIDSWRNEWDWKFRKREKEREMMQKRQRFHQRFETLIRNIPDISKGIQKKRKNKKINSSGQCSNLVKSFVARTTYFTIVVGSW